MAKKKAEEKINLDSILFKCRDILRKARNSGSFFEKRDMMLTLVFLRFIGEKFEDGVENLRRRLKDEGMTTVFEKKQDLNSRIKVFPNPYSMSPAYADDPSLLPSLKATRVPVIAASAVIIAFPGGMGTEAEIEIALAKERIVIPVISNKSDYDNAVVKKILSDSSNWEQIKKRTTRFCALIEDKKVTEADTLLAIREVINGKE